MDIREKIVEIMNGICNVPVTEHTEEDLFESGVLDSLTVMQLVGELCDAFEIDLDVDDVTHDHFCSVDHVIELVRKYMKAEGD